MMSTFFRRRVLPRQLAILERIEFSLCSYLIGRLLQVGTVTFL